MFWGILSEINCAWKLHSSHLIWSCFCLQKLIGQKYIEVVEAEEENCARVQTVKVVAAQSGTNSQVRNFIETRRVMFPIEVPTFLQLLSLFENSHRTPKGCNSRPQMRENGWNGAKEVISQAARLQITTFLGLTILRPKRQISTGTANTENKCKTMVSSFVQCFQWQGFESDWPLNCGDCAVQCAVQGFLNFLGKIVYQ